MKKYKVQLLAGDLNAHHPRWCRAHDDKRRGERMIKIAREIKNATVVTPDKPTFEAIKCKATGKLRTSTVYLVLSRAKVQHIRRVETYAAAASDH